MIPPTPKSSPASVTPTASRTVPRSPEPARPAAYTHADVAQRAYDIYAQSGYEQGRCKANWESAEKDLREHGAVACQAEHHKWEVFAPDATAPSLKNPSASVTAP